MLKANSFPERVNALRVALMVAAAYWVTYRFAINPYWVLITIVFVAQPNIGATLSRSKQRALSTIIGVVVGGFFVIVLHHILWLYALVGTLSVFFAVLFLSKRYDVFVFFLTVIIILSFGYDAVNVWHFVLFRFVDTIIGIAVAFIFAFTFFPVSALTFLKRDFIKTMDFLPQLMALTLSEFGQDNAEPQIAMGKLRTQLYDLQGLAERHYADLLSETRLLNRKRACSEAVLLQSERVRAGLRTINAVRLSCADVPADVISSVQRLNESSQKIFSSIVLALSGQAQWRECGIEQFAQTELLAQLAGQTQPEMIYLEQRFRYLIYDLVALYRACQYFSELYPSPFKMRNL